MLGFTYNGIHSSTFGLYYIPDAEDQWFNDAEYDVYDNDVDWRHGGYYYDSKAKNRTFTIKCYFEEIDVAKRQQIKQWLKRDTNGQLFFDNMPFVYWIVHPAKIPVGKWYLDTAESHSGTVTITFNAYEPFGYLVRKYNSPSTPDDNAEDYCNLINSDEMPAAPTTTDTVFNVYNPGTEDCGLSIEVAGSTTNKFRFYNESNGTECVFGSLPTNSTHVRVDGETGYVGVGNGGASGNGYAYHDRGVIRLNPNTGRSDVPFTYNGVTGTTYSFDLSGYPVDNSMIGATMEVEGLNNTTFTVISTNKPNNRIYCTRTGSGTPSSTGECSIKTVNRIVVQEYVSNNWTTTRSTLSLSYIDIDYFPRLL